MKREDFAFSPEIVVMDVSFISATYIIPAISACILDGGVFLCLIKPQFEVGRANIGKGGIVKDEKARAEAVEKVVSCATEHGFSTVGVVRSDIKGGDGNVEFIGCFKKII
jgi:23S rRNA (cytidine1920-2'-O)/16S rRNA (cytidine1409-2'-O)-methyltransferase